MVNSQSVLYFGETGYRGLIVRRRVTEWLDNQDVEKADR